MTHLTEEQLNLYLDNALSPSERAAIESHLASCEACRIELISMQTLFTALDTLQLKNLTTDLAPLVLNDIAIRRQRAIQRYRISWLASGLQGAVTIFLLLFGWSTLMMRYNEVVQRIPTDVVVSPTQAETLIRGIIFWATTTVRWQMWWTEITANLLALPGMFSQAIGHWPELKFAGPGITTPQIIIVGLAATLMWLVGNLILLRTASAHSNLSRRSNH